MFIFNQKNQVLDVSEVYQLLRGCPGISILGNGFIEIHNDYGFQAVKQAVIENNYKLGLLTLEKV